MLMKLLLIKMVASKVLGFSSSFRILFETGLSSPFKLSKSLGDSEKKATSEPEIRAEATNKTRMTMLDKARLILEISSTKKGRTFKAKSSAPGSAPNIFLLILKKNYCTYRKYNSCLRYFAVLGQIWSYMFTKLLKFSKHISLTFYTTLACFKASFSLKR